MSALEDPLRNKLLYGAPQRSARYPKALAQGPLSGKLVASLKRARKREAQNTFKRLLFWRDGMALRRRRLRAAHDRAARVPGSSLMARNVSRISLPY